MTENLYGDVELDARGMRALAHPTRLAILRYLQTHGPSTATGLSGDVGVSPSVASWHLRHLAEYGLVRDAPRSGSGRQRWWQAVNDFRFTVVDADSADAARLLTDVLEQTEGDLAARWRTEIAPHLEAGWQRVSGRTNTTIVVTADELERIQAGIEKLLAPFVLRKDTEPDSWPATSRQVRILRYTMPELEVEPDQQP